MGTIYCGPCIRVTASKMCLLLMQGGKIQYTVFMGAMPPLLQKNEGKCPLCLRGSSAYAIVVCTTSNSPLFCETHT